MPNPSRQLKKIYSLLFKALGPQHWWPGETPFEVMVGAILTQNTNWGNVEKAIANLKRERCLTPRALKDLSTPRLAALIRPSGYYNIKAKRLKNFISFLFKEFNGNLPRMAQMPLPLLRDKILSVKGIGPETADSMLLYALNKRVFVIDAYTRRILNRHGLAPATADYHELQELFMRIDPTGSSKNSPPSQFFNEYHALLVALGKNYCRPKMCSQDCPLRPLAPHGPGSRAPEVKKRNRML